MKKREEKRVIQPSIRMLDSILWLEFQNTYSLTLCLSRVHQHYENGKLNGPLQGVNMPFSIIYNWTYSIGLSRLSQHESDLWLSIASFHPDYLVAHVRGDRSTAMHEFAHARFHLDSAYSLLSHSVWTSLSRACRIAVAKDLVVRYVINNWCRGYAADRCIDEFQAYLVESPSAFGKKWASELQEPQAILKKALDWKSVYIKLYFE